MSFQLFPGAALQTVVRQLAVDRLDAAIAVLEPAAPVETGVHDARKRLKEVRALARLLRGALADQYRDANAQLRELGHQLASSRDAQALLEIFDQLAAPPHGRSPLTPQTTRSIRARLEARQRQAAAATLSDATLASVRTELAALRDRCESWSLAAEEFDAIAPGLARSYRDGRRQLKALYSGKGKVRGNDADFHQWRKRVKDQWYQTRLLRPLWPDGLGGRQQALKGLARMLGEDHDLALLRGTLAAEPGLFGKRTTVALLDDCARERQETLRAAALPTGRCLYAEKPTAYCKRMGAYWTAWRQATG